MYWDTFDLSVMEDEQTQDGHVFIQRILFVVLAEERIYAIIDASLYRRKSKLQYIS